MQNVQSAIEKLKLVNELIGGIRKMYMYCVGKNQGFIDILPINDIMIGRNSSKYFKLIILSYKQQ